MSRWIGRTGLPRRVLSAETKMFRRTSSCLARRLCLDAGRCPLSLDHRCQRHLRAGSPPFASVPPFFCLHSYFLPLYTCCLLFYYSGHPSGQYFFLIFYAISLSRSFTHCVPTIYSVSDQYDNIQVATANAIVFGVLIFATAVVALLIGNMRDIASLLQAALPNTVTGKKRKVQNVLKEPQYIQLPIVPDPGDNSRVIHTEEIDMYVSPHFTLLTTHLT